MLSFVAFLGLFLFVVRNRKIPRFIRSLSLSVCLPLSLVRACARARSLSLSLNTFTWIVCVSRTLSHMDGVYHTHSHTHGWCVYHTHTHTQHNHVDSVFVCKRSMSIHTNTHMLSELRLPLPPLHTSLHTHLLGPTLAWQF